MAQSFEKRSWDARPFDFRMALALSAGETIASGTVVADPSGGAAPLVFGSPVVNGAAIKYADGVTEPIGTVLQVPISGGSTMPDGSARRYTVRARCLTSAGNNVEGTAILILNDKA